jgi:tellurite resistance protein
VWRTRDGDLVVIDHVPAPALVGPFLLDDYRHDLRLTAGAHRGGLIECELHDRLGVVGITKEPQAQGQGVLIRGYALAPSPRGHLAVSMLAQEGGATGSREAHVLRDSGTIPLDWLGDPYGYEHDSTQDFAPMRAMSSLKHERDPWASDLFVRNRSDSRRFDAVFPRHPLTRVREHLNQLGGRLELTASPPPTREQATACGLRFGVPLGHLRISSAEWGCLYRRVSFAGRIQFMTVTHRPAACATDPRAVAQELERVERAGRIQILQGPRHEQRSIGGFRGIYTEYEARSGKRELYVAAFNLPVGSHAVEISLSGERDDWVRANRDLNVVVRSASTQGQDDSGELSETAIERIYRMLVRLAYCDDSIDPCERDVLDAFQIKYGLDPDRGAQLERESATSDKHRIGRELGEQNLLLRAMVEVAVADGVLDPAEVKRLRMVARAMGVSEHKLMQLVQERLG